MENEMKCYGCRKTSTSEELRLLSEMAESFGFVLIATLKRRLWTSSFQQARESISLGSNRRQSQEEYDFRTFHGWEGFVKGYEEAGQVELQGLFTPSVEVVEGEVVVAASNSLIVTTL